jgi:UDP-N-acetylmuramyl pentapeptide phosphotransferase/UDP-N-acetylglucosamine-1-phosphate transferase
MLIIRLRHLHSHFSGDSDLSGPQKFHKFSVPRIGGISIAVGILTATLIRLQLNISSNIEIAILIFTIPTFFIGLTEDLTKRVGVKTRLFFTAIAAAMAVNYFGLQIYKLDVPGVDYLLTVPGLAMLFTIFAITGLANAYNIIDGFNGLSSMVGIITLMGLCYVGYAVGDTLIMHLSLVMAAAILGFFLWNYPRGLIFLGDGGAYLIGFWIGITTIMLVIRNPDISPWFALLVNASPIIETVYTI